VRFLEEKGITLDQWNQIRNEFEETLKSCKEEVERLVERYKKGEIDRGEMRSRMTLQMKVFATVCHETLELAREAINWISERRRTQGLRR